MEDVEDIVDEDVVEEYADELWELIVSPLELEQLLLTKAD